MKLGWRMGGCWPRLTPLTFVADLEKWMVPGLFLTYFKTQKVFNIFVNSKRLVHGSW